MIGPIITVTLNPAIDRTVWIQRLLPGTTHRSSDTRTIFGGKGINVARTIAQLGAPVSAIGIAGEDQWALIEEHLGSLGVQARFLATPGETRTNLKLIEQDGRLTEINGSGPAVSSELAAAFETELLSTVRRTRAGAVVLAGSLPLGLEASVYARWTRRLQRLEPAVRVLIDASNGVLEQAISAEPFLLKPNRVEAESLVGHPIHDVDEAVAAAIQLQDRGPRAVLLSLGSAGAVACIRGKVEVIAPKPIAIPANRLLTTVGAGDAMVARIAVELGRRSESELETDEFFAICREAVAEAERHIATSTKPALDPTLPSVSRQSDSLDGSWPPSGERVEAPMSEP